MPEVIDKPKVFISYSWSSEKHKLWVLTFAESLVSDGVDVILDRYMLGPGQNNIDFMEYMVADEVKHVLVICDKGYQEKANKKEGGVGVESQIISPKVYKDVKQNKFIPLIREFDKEGNACVPIFFEARNYIDISTDTKYYREYENILRIIFDKPAISKPEIGQPPGYILKYKKRSEINRKYLILENAILDEKKTAKGLYSDLLDQYIKEWPNYILYPFHEEEGKIFDDAVVNSINEFSEYKDVFLSSLLLIANYTADNYFIGELHRFFEESLSYAFNPPDLSRFSQFWFDNFRYFLYDLFLNAVTILIQKRRYDDFNTFVQSQFVFKMSGTRKINEFTIFDFYIETLDDMRNKRLSKKRASIQVDMLKKRTDKNTQVDFENIMQSDCLLFLKSLALESKPSWFPRTLIYAGYGQTFDLFIRAQDKECFLILANLIGVKSKTELISNIVESERFKQLVHSRYFIWSPLEIRSLINLNNLYEG